MIIRSGLPPGVSANCVCGYGHRGGTGNATDTSLPERCVVRVLEGRKQQGRKPKHMIIDSGTELTSHDLAIRCLKC